MAQVKELYEADCSLIIKLKSLVTWFLTFQKRFYYLGGFSGRTSDLKPNEFFFQYHYSQLCKYLKGDNSGFYDSKSRGISSTNLFDGDATLLLSGSDENISAKRVFVRSATTAIQILKDTQIKKKVLSKMNVSTFFDKSFESTSEFYTNNVTDKLARETFLIGLTRFRRFTSILFARFVNNQLKSLRKPCG